MEDEWVQNRAQHYLTRVITGISNARLSDEDKATLVTLVKEQDQESLVFIAREAHKDIFRAPEATVGEEGLRSRVCAQVMNWTVGPYLHEKGLSVPQIHNVSRHILSALGYQGKLDFETE